jgi:hypothetical protein
MIAAAPAMRTDPSWETGFQLMSEQRESVAAKAELQERALIKLASLAATIAATGRDHRGHDRGQSPLFN